MCSNKSVEHELVRQPHFLFWFKLFVFLQVMSACCLFLAGKVEETPKKCKDIIRTVQTLLSPEGFQAFGDDPRVGGVTLQPGSSSAPLCQWVCCEKLKIAGASCLAIETDISELFEQVFLSWCFYYPAWVELLCIKDTLNKYEVWHFYSHGVEQENCDFVLTCVNSNYKLCGVWHVNKAWLLFCVFLVFFMMDVLLEG